MTVETQRAIADADAAGSKLTQAQKDLQAALDEHFGTGGLGRGEQPRIADRKTVLSRLVEEGEGQPIGHHTFYRPDEGVMLERAALSLSPLATSLSCIQLEAGEASPVG